MGSFIEMVDGLAKQVEQEKMKAIGARNLLKSIAKEREAQKQQLQALIAEKKMQLERCGAAGHRVASHPSLTGQTSGPQH